MNFMGVLHSFYFSYQYLTSTFEGQKIPFYSVVLLLNYYHGILEFFYSSD